MIAKTVLIKIPEDYHQTLKMLALATNQTMSQLIMKWVDDARTRILDIPEKPPKSDSKAAMQRILKYAIQK